MKRVDEERPSEWEGASERADESEQNRTRLSTVAALSEVNSSLTLLYAFAPAVSAVDALDSTRTDSHERLKERIEDVDLEAAS